MTPEMEDLLKKVNDIHRAVLGYDGAPEEGLLYKSRDHEKRIGALESWRWYVLGAIAAIGIIAKAMKVL